MNEVLSMKRREGGLLLIPDPDRIEDSLELAEQYGACFEYNDFYDPVLLDDREKTKERLRLYQALGRDLSGDTLHGVFYDVTIHSDDPQIRRVSERRVYQSMEAAAELGVKGVVFHTGLIPNFTSSFYLDAWLSRNVRFWAKVREDFPEQEIYLENMFDRSPDMLAAFAKETGTVTSGVGVCLDYAHVHVFGEAAGKDAEKIQEADLWMDKLAPYIRHIHINDNDGRVDSHEAVGDGIIDWDHFTERIKRSGITASVLVETRPMDKQRRSLEYMKEHAIFPFL